MKPFSCSRTPECHFGQGTLSLLPGYLSAVGVKKCAVITGAESFTGTEKWHDFRKELHEKGISVFHASVRGEPSVESIDAVVSGFKNDLPDRIISIGGGSVLDTGKAVSAMLMEEGSVEDYLEGVGNLQPSGRKISFIAVPTTAGTGSEATKNAVISRTGEKGFKKSLRHEAYIPDLAIIDPNLMAGCPKNITAASGLDAVTQLLESYVSTGHTPFTDSLALDALRHAGKSYPWAVEEGKDVKAREGMAWAAFVSGITLANAGLGVVHGLASELGGMKDIPHGVVCASLVGEATSAVVMKLQFEFGWEHPALIRFSRAGAALSGKDRKNIEDNCESLIDKLEAWVEQYRIPRLSEYGFTREDLKSAAEKSVLKNTPVKLIPDDILTFLMMRY